MQNTVTAIFPYQLFQNQPRLHKNVAVYFIEDALFFKQFNFHQQKLVLHRASTKFYESWLKEQQYEVHYAGTHSSESDCGKLVHCPAKQNTIDIHFADPADNYSYINFKMQTQITYTQLIEMEQRKWPHFPVRV
jgi:deoxyribodipyrimidine photolyase-related protein